MPWLLLAIFCWSHVSVSLELISGRRNLIVSIQWPSKCTVPQCWVIHSCLLLIAQSETQQDWWDSGCLSPWQSKECPNLNPFFSSVAWYFRRVLHNFNVSVQPGKEIGARAETTAQQWWKALVCILLMKESLIPCSQNHIQFNRCLSPRGWNFPFWLDSWERFERF